MLSIKNLCYRHLINNITLHLKKGSIYALLGPNGSGKSTFFKALKKIWVPCYGEVWWEDKNILQMPHADISKVIAYQPQNAEPTFDFTVQEFVEMGRYPLKINKLALEEALHRADLLHKLQTPITQLSGGERVRAYLARTLYTDCPVLLLDEPTSALDSAHRHTFFKTMLELKERGKILIIATHDLTAAKKHADELIVFASGECKGVFSPASMVSDAL